MRKFIKKIADFIWTLLGGIAILFVALASMIGEAFLLWPHKSGRGESGEKEKSNIGWFLYPHLFQRTFSNRVYVLIILILAAIIGVVLFLAYFR